MKAICLSAGHDYSDPGAVYDAGTKESVITMQLVQKTAEMLRKFSIPVLTVPDNIGLVETIAWINDRKDQIELAVELHCDSATATARGTSGWYYHADDTSKKLCQFIIDGISVESGIPVRGTYDEYTNRWGKLGFVHDTTPLAALIEMGFISNEQDRKVLTSDSGQMNVAKGITRGILGYMGIAWNPSVLDPKPVVDIGADYRKQIDLLNRALKDTQEKYARLQNETATKVADAVAKCKIDFKQKVIELINKYE